ncbi:hypothetical protein [Phenylobacterium sp.]|uniref:hypothetical protein n=1 Tax=Phenylobacterium sp. TaxID=1871053 RepID=UPI0027306364|nr:hypothetical protein [Phenylobacterium sp.]MDP1619301.1 hypothetical protein [Phenylobacterium sp.]MDP1987898.1 hypothetical protein [Phenylobacterium sp.]
MFTRNAILAIGAWSGLATLLVALPAEAGQHGRTRTVQGPFGAGYVQARQVSRQPGAISVQQSVQTHAGYGAAHSRNASWSDGVYQGGASHSFNNGASAGRSTTLQDNGDGSISYARARTGLQGQTSTATGTFQRPPR